MGPQSEPSVSGSGWERTSKGAKCSFPRQRETKHSGLCDDEARLSAISARSEMAIFLPGLSRYRAPDQIVQRNAVKVSDTDQSRQLRFALSMLIALICPGNNTYCLCKFFL